jgi:hypothetical protein
MALAAKVVLKLASYELKSELVDDQVGSKDYSQL